jgi:hypothetical protein
LQLSSVQALPSSQVTRFEPTQVPASQNPSACRRYRRSRCCCRRSYRRSSRRRGCSCRPVQALPSSQTTGFEPTHVPASQNRSACRRCRRSRCCCRRS